MYIQKVNHISTWINQALAADPPRHKSLVMTICGDSIAPHGARFWLGSMIDLVAPLGLSDRLVRTSVFRLVQEGWLSANREGRRSCYQFAASALPRIERANRRIYSHPGLDWNGRWTLLLAPAANISSEQRAMLRKELEWEGHAQLANGVMAHPAPDLEMVREILARCGVQEQVFVLEATQLPALAGRALPELIRDHWNLEAVDAAYQDFIARFSPLAALLAGAPVTPEQAFVVRTLLIHAYRRVQLHDPMLPLALLPTPWPGAQAYALARTIYRLCQAEAEAHVLTQLRREDPATPDADCAYWARFDGLDHAAGLA